MKGLCLFIALVSVVSVHAQDSPGLHLPRTMSLVESSSPEHKTPITILVYGQSIAAQGYADKAISKWIAERYPNAVVTLTNPSIGGYEAHMLRFTSWQDMYNQNPDLVVFHVYGGEDGGLEEIYKGIKDNLTAEVLLWTDHVDATPAETSGVREKHSGLIQSLAAKYGYEVADARALWKEDLAKNNLQPQYYLKDAVHLNDKGGALLGQAVLARFQKNPDASTDWLRRIHKLSLDQPQAGITYEAGSWKVEKGGLVSSSRKPLRIAFTGNRVDLVALPGFGGSAKILLDGKTPSTLRDTLTAGRSTNSPHAWWPAITWVALGDSAVPQTYTMRFHDVAPDGSKYAFDVSGSISGDEGSGKSGELFTAKEGGFTIKSGHIALPSVNQILHKPLPTGFVIEWPIFSMSKDAWQSTASSTPGEVIQETVIRCWTDGPHVLDILPDGDHPVGIRETIIFSPSGKAAP